MIKVEGEGTAEVVDVPNKERLRLWVDALRSGKYKQVSNVLRGYFEWPEGQEKPTYGYCCLGVACEVAAANGCDFDLELAFDEKTAETLPYEVTEWLGLVAEFDNAGDDGFDPVLRVDPPLDGFDTPEKKTASMLNDDVGLNFDEIADLIEAKYNLKDAA